MKKIVVVVLALFLLSNNAWAGEVYQNQTQQSQYCQNIVTQGNKEAQRHPNRPDTMLLWEQGHPGCYNSTTTPGQKQGVLDAIDGIFVQANSALFLIEDAGLSGGDAAFVVDEFNQNFAVAHFEHGRNRRTPVHQWATLSRARRERSGAKRHLRRHQSAIQGNRLVRSGRQTELRRKWESVLCLRECQRKRGWGAG